MYIAANDIVRRSAIATKVLLLAIFHSPIFICAKLRKHISPITIYIPFSVAPLQTAHKKLTAFLKENKDTSVTAVFSERQPYPWESKGLLGLRSKMKGERRIRKMQLAKTTTPREFNPEPTQPLFFSFVSLVSPMILDYC